MTRLRGALRAGDALGRRPAEDRRRRATARRWWWASATASTSSPRTSRPSSPTPATSSSSGDEEMAVVTQPGRGVLRPRRRRAIAQDAHAHHLGPDRGREGRLQALHAQGDLRAAGGRARHRAGPRLARDAARSSATRPALDRRRPLRAVERVTLIACGTSWHAALVGKFLIEELARIPGRGRLRVGVPLPRSRSSTPHTLAVAITQSGETADTLAAMREARTPGAQQPRDLQRRRAAWPRARPTARIYTHAGPEIGVASTKAFTAQLVALYLLALHLAQAARHAHAEAAQGHIADLLQLPQQIEQRPRSAAPQIEELASRFHTRPTSSTSGAASTTRSRSKARSSSRRSPTSTPRAIPPAR